MSGVRCQVWKVGEGGYCKDSNDGKDFFLTEAQRHGGGMTLNPFSDLEILRWEGFLSPTTLRRGNKCFFAEVEL